MVKNALARIKINKLLEAAGWRLFPNGNRGKTKHGVSVYEQGSNYTNWQLEKMNLTIRGIDSNFGLEHADAFHRFAVTDRSAHREEMRGHAH